MVIAIIGIMKAGASYVPVDASYPESRITYLVQNSEVSLAITDGETNFHFLEKHCPTLNIAKEKDNIFDGREVTGLPHLTGSDSAYLIYTSGSTGNPKGVVITHSTAANYIINHIALAEVEPTDRQLQFASVSFDVSLMEIFSPLVAGGRCVLMNEPSTITMQELTAIIETHQTNSVFVPPSYWVSWMEYLYQCNKRAPACIKRLYIGADKIEHYMVDLWKRTCDSNVDLYNGYGPTEATVCATILKFRTDKLSKYVETGRIPIGKATGNTKVFILDEFLKPVPIGAPGEIFIGGDVLAKEYFGDPKLTAEKFIDNPLESNEGLIGKMYRTGDLARFLPCGNIEFLGRIDDQVKVNGYRIELGEIENALTQYEEVSEVAVLVITNSDNKSKFIAAFIVASNKSITSGELIERLKKSLPHYMVPSKIQFLNALPKMPNGKLDRSHLKELLFSTKAELKSPGVFNESQQLIADIWSQVLAVEVSTLDKKSDFIQAGGNSIKFILIVTLISEQFGSELDFISFFDKSTTTIEELANHIDISLQKAEE
jgi:amino acid adenylation domain-containing protein